MQRHAPLELLDDVSAERGLALHFSAVFQQAIRALKVPAPTFPFAQRSGQLLLLLPLLQLTPAQ